MPFPSIIISSGGITFTEQIGAIQTAHGAALRAKSDTRSSTSPMRTPWPLHGGLGSGSQPRPNGNLPRAEASPVNPLFGVTNFALREDGWQTSTRANFQYMTPVKTATSELQRSHSIRPTAMDYTIWQAMSGNGPATGIGRTTTSNSLPPA